MDPARRKELEKIALEQLAATADNDEQWSYAWGDPGGKSFSFCSWAQYEEEKFDGTVEGLDLPWTEERQQLIETGQADPNEFELRQWRVAKCREAAASDEPWLAWITPMRTPSGDVEAFALWIFSARGAPEDPPELWGVFDSIDGAEAKLRASGVVHE